MAHQGATRSLLAFVDAVLRGVGQVMFQNHPVSGALFLLAIAANGFAADAALAAQGVSAPLLLAGAIAGTAASTLTAILSGADRDRIAAGLYGFNGTLVGIALPYFFRPSPLLGVVLLVAAACSSVVMAALQNVLDRWEIPPLTAPFVLTTWLFIAASSSFGGLYPSGFLSPPSLPAPPSSAPLSLEAIVEGLLSGVGQVMLEGHWVAGIVFLLGILVNSRRSFVFALLGSLAGLSIGELMGADAGALSLGLYGFNPVLTGIAMGSVFSSHGPKAVLWAIFGVGVTIVATGAVAAMLMPIGLPALTWPFVSVTWLWLLARSEFTAEEGGRPRTPRPPRAPRGS